jgi:uncharacterized protein (TIGR03435 family)
VKAQSASPELSFEAATVKPRIMDYSHGIVMLGIHVYEARSSYSLSLKALFTYAYKLRPDQVSGPEWMDKDNFDIEARFPKGATIEDEPKMLQALLKERFKLTFHLEKKELEGYALVVGKHGAKLTPSATDSTKSAADAPPKPGSGDTMPKLSTNKDGSNSIDMGDRGTQTMKFDQENWATHFERNKMTMGELAMVLGHCFGGDFHKVDDQTQIKGDYQIAWDCPVGGHRPASGGDASDAMPSDPQGSGTLNKSLDELGLRLEKRKVSLDVYIIDHVEKPSEN